MNDELRDKWNRRHGAAEDHGAVALVLRDNPHLLPSTGLALDLACGRGANSLFLAEHGLTVEAWDLADVAIDGLDREARSRGLPIAARVRDVERQPPQRERFDVIVVSHFFSRPLCPHLSSALRAGGLLFYQTWTRARVDDSGPRNSDFRLADNELLDLFAPLRTRVYREEGRIGDTARGFRNQAMYVGQKSG